MSDMTTATHRLFDAIRRYGRDEVLAVLTQIEAEIAGETELRDDIRHGAYMLLTRLQDRLGMRKERS